MKKISLFILLVVAISSANAQNKKVSFGVGPSIAVPTGFFQLANSVGFGALGNVYIAQSDQFELYGQTGVQIFTGKSLFGENGGSSTQIPFMGGVRYNTNGFIIGLGLGGTLYKLGGEPNSTFGFSINPSLGYSFGKFEVNANYHTTTSDGVNINYIGIGSAIKF